MNTLAVHFISMFILFVHQRYETLERNVETIEAEKQHNMEVEKVIIKHSNNAIETRERRYRYDMSIDLQ